MALDEEDRKTLYKMSGQLDALVDAINRHFDDDKTSFGELRKEVSSIRGKVKWLSGAWAVAGGIAVYLFKGAH